MVTKDLSEESVAKNHPGGECQEGRKQGPGLSLRKADIHDQIRKDKDEPDRHKGWQER